MHRTVEIPYLPRTQKNWATFTSSRQEAAKLWFDLILRHHRIRRLRWKWPSKPKWFKWAKGRYPGLHSHAVQHIILEFMEATEATMQLRKAGQSGARFPWRKTRYRDIPYTNQAVRIKKGYLVLPNGQSGTLIAKLPKGFDPEGRLIEVRLKYGKILLVYRLEDLPVEDKSFVQIGVDLGVNTLIAATDGKKAILISGREAKATVQWRNKRLASLCSKQAPTRVGSRRWKRLQKRKYKLLDKAHNRLKDLTHKATRKVVDAFPNAQAFVGEPFNEAGQKTGRVQAQQISQVCTRKVIDQLDYKLSGGAITVNEAYSSQTCPVCGCRQKCRRIYHCKQCGFKAPRDVVGSTNIRSIGREGKMALNQEVPMTIQWVRPVKYPSYHGGSSGGSPASSSSHEG